MGSTHWGIEDYLGSDPLGIALGAFYLLMGLAAALVAVGYFHRRRGPGWSFGFAAIFWAANAGGVFAVARGKPTWPSLASLGVAALVTFGFATFLAVRRRRPPGGEAAPPAPPLQRRCPGCGLTIDGRYEKCPVCGAGRQP